MCDVLVTGPVGAVPHSEHKLAPPQRRRAGQAGPLWLIAEMSQPTGNTIGRVGQEPRPLVC